MTNEHCSRCQAPITWSEANGRRWIHTDGSRSCRGAAASFARPEDEIPAWWLATPTGSR